MVRETNLIVELKKFGKKLHEELAVEKLILFGSYARGKPRKDSDVDIIIVSPKFRGIPLFLRSRGLRRRFGVKVPMDIICLTPEEFEEKRKEISIIAEAVKEGKELIAA